MNSAIDLTESSTSSPTPNPLAAPPEVADAQWPSSRHLTAAPLVEQTLLIKRPVSRRQLRLLFALGVGAGVMVALLAGSLSARSMVSPVPPQPETMYPPTVLRVPRGIAAHPIPPLRLATPARNKNFVRKTESRQLRISGKTGAGE